MQSMKLPWTRLAAEFVVIVVGVLVALLAESAWQERGERIEEKQVLERIAEDLEADSTSLVVDRDWAELALSTARESREILAGRDTLAPATRLAILYAAATVRSEARFTRTWDDLTASGRVSIIRDPDLRRGLIDFYARMDQLDRDQDELSIDYRSDVVATLPTTFTRAVLEACMRVGDVADGGLYADVESRLRSCSVRPDEDPDELLRRLRSVPGIERSLGELSYALAGVEDATLAAESSFRSLRSLLDAALGR
jgi:hypothetical protein